MNAAIIRIAVWRRAGERGLNCGVKRRLSGMEAALANGRSQIAAKTVAVVNQSKKK